MPPRRRGASGYRDVSPRLSDALSAEIRSGDVRLGLGIFETAHEAARAYDTAAWRLRRACLDMNFPEVPMREMAQELAPPPRLLTGEDHHENWRQERRRHQRAAVLHGKEGAEEGGASCLSRGPAYAEGGREFNIELGAALSWDFKDDRYLDAFIVTSDEDITEVESESDEDDE
nr:ethylene-responsive transcription factor 2-like [Aegilops tauschii subsp. strangulata]